jgi:chromosome segregation ATPase
MTAEQAAEFGKTLNFETVWATINRFSEEADKRHQETERAMKESSARMDRLSEEADRRHQEADKRHQETERAMKESSARMDRLSEEADRRHQETEAAMKAMSEEADKRHKETERVIKSNSKRFGYLSNRFGEMVEHMVTPNLLKKFEELNFTFTKANSTEIKDRKNGIFAQVDSLLENGDKVMAVEIKSKPTVEDVNGHIERMEKLRRYANLHQDSRTYLGAIAGAVFGEEEKVYALKKGFYVIEPSGNTFHITEPAGIYHPSEW